eukprot:4594977-Pyramimonas_sp.AAC.1
MGPGSWGRRIAAYRRCIGDAARCGAHPTYSTFSAPMHRRRRPCIGDALAMRHNRSTPSSRTPYRLATMASMILRT